MKKYTTKPFLIVLLAFSSSSIFSSSLSTKAIRIVGGTSLGLSAGVYGFQTGSTLGKTPGLLLLNEEERNRNMIRTDKPTIITGSALGGMAGAFCGASAGAYAGTRSVDMFKRLPLSGKLAIASGTAIAGITSIGRIVKK